ncbi:MAG: recombinase family protein [Clostridiales bacterium]|nr:recombinase family protein [Clostridiales bacterium]
MRTIYGYVRVSTQDQNLDRQLIALVEYGVPKGNIFSDHGFSGKDFNRPAYQKMLCTIEAEDTLVIKSVDRLGRNFDEMIDEWGMITRKLGVEIVVLDTPYLKSTTDIADVMSKMLNAILLDMQSGFAHIERDKIHERQKEGIAAARARGVCFGRPPKVRPPEFYVLKDEYLSGRISARKAAERLSISHSTFCRWVEQEM